MPKTIESLYTLIPTPKELSATSLASDANLQAYYKLENANDTTANGYNLSPSGSPTYVSAKFTNGVNLVSASSQFLSISSASCPNLSMTGSRTVNAWIKPTNFSAVMIVAGKRGTDYATNGGYALWVNTDATFHFSVDKLTTNTDTYSNHLLTAGGWQMVTGIYDATEQKLKVYLNGILSNQITASGTGGTNDWNFCVGCDNQGTANAPGLFFNGVIDDLAVFDRALTDAQILSIYDNSLVSYYTMDCTEDTNTKLLLHFNGNDGAVSTIESTTARAPTWAGTAHIDTSQKKFGSSSLLLDGDSDYMTFLDSDDWTFAGGNFTIDCWVRFADLTGQMAIVGQHVDANNLWYLYKTTDHKLGFYARQSSSDVVNLVCASASFAEANVWYHIAFVRNGANGLIFVNGVSQTLTGTDITGVTLANLASTLRIGFLWATQPFYFNGWIDELRVVKGAAKWTTDFTPPTTPYYYGTDDSSINGYHIVPGVLPTYVPSQFEKGGSFASASSQYLYQTIAYRTNLIGSQTFTLWYKPATLTDAALIQTGTAVGGEKRLFFTHAGGDKVIWQLAGLTTNSTITSDVTLVNGAWNHIAGVYDSVSQKLKVWVNGTKKEVTASGYANSVANNLYMASSEGTVNYANGVIDDCAIFARALSDDEITNIYKSGFVGGYYI